MFALLTPWQFVTFAALAALAAGGALVGFIIWKRKRLTPEERERQRRAALVLRGKITDANLVEIQENTLFYSYLVRGIEYTASQDITMLKSHLPEEGGLGLGPVAIKYDAHNPANSIVVDERWSGLRYGKAQARTHTESSASR